ncbi:hypothetical protein DdX_15842 [Ditylenchus destructor]|uniref:Dynein light chain n=1 Tax=Ditylenchus destructor TaxID=166010 RepID=A0AAD4R0H2_9BILA|nr:hypothetical protein DdX_15842 [Ditylenchus destructor]
MSSDSEEEVVNRGGVPDLELADLEYEPRIEIISIWNVEDGLKTQIVESVKSAFTKFVFKNEIVNAIHDELREKIGGGWICIMSRDDFVTNNINANSTEPRESALRFLVDLGYHLLICRLFCA